MIFDPNLGTFLACTINIWPQLFFYLIFSSYLESLGA